jgi:uncharacterized protein (DUF433 family)
MKDYLNEPGVWITPARQGGSPCIIGTRVTIDVVENYLWDSRFTVEEVMDTYDLTRGQVLCAAWVAGDLGLLRRKKQRKAWAAWADDNLHKAWHGGWDTMPPPPSRAEQ